MSGGYTRGVDVSELLLKSRNGAGLTQAALAAGCGVGQSAISKYERGIVVPSIKNVLRIAKFLRIPDVEIGFALSGGIKMRKSKRFPNVNVTRLSSVPEERISRRPESTVGDNVDTERPIDVQPNIPEDPGRIPEEIIQRLDTIESACKALGDVPAIVDGLHALLKTLSDLSAAWSVALNEQRQAVADIKSVGRFRFTGKPE